MKKSRYFHGLSTGVKLEEQARSILSKPRQWRKPMCMSLVCVSRNIPALNQCFWHCQWNLRLPDYGIRDVLHQHANAFVEWRYIHEKREHGISFDFTTFVATLEMVLDEFATLYRSEPISPQRKVLPPR
jgi:hypothetical protein